MWVRKDVFELVKDDRERNRERFRPWIPLILGLGVGLLFMLIGHLAGSRDWGPQPLGEAALDGLFCGVLFLVGTYAVRIFGWKFWFHGGRPKTVLCEWCKKAFEGKPGSICDCGGKLEPLDDWKWVEELATAERRETSDSDHSPGNSCRRASS